MRSVCHTPSTPVTIGIATVSATRAVRNRARSGPRRSRRRRSDDLARGRVCVMCSSGPGASTEQTTHRHCHGSVPVRARLAGIVGVVRATTIGDPITTLTRARRGTRVRGRRTSAAPTIATGTIGAPVVKARRAAPRCQGRSAGPSTVPCGKIATARAVLERPGGARDRIQVAAPPFDGNAAERVEQTPGEAVAPELSLREEPQRSLERGAEEERVGERVVVRDHDRRACGDVLRADDVESPDAANCRPERSRGQPRRASSARAGADRPCRIGGAARVPLLRPVDGVPCEQRAILLDHARPLDQPEVRVRGACVLQARGRTRCGWSRLGRSSPTRGSGPAPPPRAPGRGASGTPAPTRPGRSCRG